MRDEVTDDLPVSRHGGKKAAAAAKASGTTGKQATSLNEFKKSKTTNSHGAGEQSSVMSIAVKVHVTSKSTHASRQRCDNTQPAKSKLAPAVKTVIKKVRPRYQCLPSGLLISLQDSMPGCARKKGKISCSPLACHSLLIHLQTPQWRGSDSAFVQEGPSTETKGKKKPKVTNNQTWPADTHITLQLDGKMSLKAQKPAIRAVCRLAFIHLYAKLLFENAFLNAAERVQFSCDALYLATKQLEHENMIECLQSDVNYMDVMGKLVSVTNNTCLSFQWLYPG